MNEMLLIDLETQDFRVESGIYEVACIAVRNYEIIDQLYLGKEIDGYMGRRKYGYGFHDISRDDEHVGKFKSFIAQYPYPIVAHNCPFDRKFLTYYNWISHEYPSYCSMRAIRMENGTLSSYALSNLISHYQIADEVEHDAMSDIMNVYQILKILQPRTWLPVGSKGIQVSSKQKPRDKDKIDLDIEQTHTLLGEVVCFTGTSIYQRSTMQEIAKVNGAEVSDNVTSNTTMLVVGVDAGSKLDKAQEKGISIISDDEFMKILNLYGKQVTSRKEE